MFSHATARQRTLNREIARQTAKSQEKRRKASKNRVFITVSDKPRLYFKFQNRNRLNAGNEQKSKTERKCGNISIDGKLLEIKCLLINPFYSKYKFSIISYPILTLSQTGGSVSINISLSPFLESWQTGILLASVTSTVAISASNDELKTLSVQFPAPGADWEI